MRGMANLILPKSTSTAANSARVASELGAGESLAVKGNPVCQIIHHVQGCHRATGSREGEFVGRAGEAYTLVTC